MKKDFSLLRKFTGAEGELPCDTFGDALSPSSLKAFLAFGVPIWNLPLAWLEGKPVYPDSLVCWEAAVWGTENIDQARQWVGWDDPECLALFSWPVAEKKETLGSADKYVKKDFTPIKTKAQQIRGQLDVQGQDGNWNYDSYMHGMYNGLECALATLEGRAPKYRDAPDVWLRGAPPKTYNVVVLIDGEVNYQAKAAPGGVITTYIKSE